MDIRATVECMFSVGERHSLRTDDSRLLLLKLCVLCFKYVNRRSLWESLFKADYVHWDLVEQNLNGNILGDIGVWLSVFKYCNWDLLYRQEELIAKQHHPLSATKKNLKENGLDMGGDTGWTLVCKVFVLSLIRGLPGLHSLEIFTCDVFKKDTRQQCMNFLSKQSDNLFTPEEYANTLEFVLSNCAVDTVSLDHAWSLVQAKRVDRSLCLKLKNVSVVQGRPRLRDRITSTLKTDERKTQLDTALSKWESYTGFCYKHQFPPTLSENVKQKFYFMASQTQWNWNRHLHKILQSADTLLEKVAAYPVSEPELPVIIRVIEGLNMDGSAPFKEMMDFKTNCLQSLPVTQVQKLTQTQILQLYVAAHQNPVIWREVWKHIIGVISVLIIQDCERFVVSVPFSENDFMRLLCR